MHYYQFNIGDYHAHTSHLEPLEDIAYRRMMDFCYLNEIPLPPTVEEIGRLIRMRSHTDCIAIVLSEFFTKVNGGYVQERINNEIGKYRDKSEKAKKSAEARWGSKDKGLGDANALRPHSEGNAKDDDERNAKQEPLNKKQEPLTNNHKPINNNQEPLKGKEPKTRFAPELSDCLSWGWPQIPSGEIFSAWLTMRKTNKHTISEASFKTIGHGLREAAANGFTVDQCLEAAELQGWKGFKSDWMINSRKPSRSQAKNIKQAEADAWAAGDDFVRQPSGGNNLIEGDFCHG